MNKATIKCRFRIQVVKECKAAQELTNDPSNSRMRNVILCVCAKCSLSISEEILHMWSMKQLQVPTASIDKVVRNFRNPENTIARPSINEKKRVWFKLAKSFDFPNLRKFILMIFQLWHWLALLMWSPKTSVKFQQIWTFHAKAGLMATMPILLQIAKSSIFA